MSTVQEIIDSANTRVSESITSADTYLDALQDLANGISYDVGYTAQPHYPVPNISHISSIGPDLNNTQLDEVASSSASEAINLSIWGLPAFHDFNELSPVLDIPTRPNLTWPEQPNTPQITDIATPATPEIETPENPEIIWEELPVLANIEMPVFDATTPEIGYLAPSNNFIFEEQSYSSDLKTQLEEILLNDVQNGGYGINPDDEQNLFNRERDRETQNVLQAEQEVIDIFAAKGFPIPPGAALADTQKILETAQASLSTVNRDIALKRAELYVQARQFSIQYSISWEQAFINLQNAKMERALNYAKATSTFTLEFYNAEAQRFNSELSLHAALRDSYQAKLTGVRALIDKERLQFDRSKLSDERQQNIQEYHKLKILTVNTIYNLYRTKLESAQIKANIERLKLEKYKADNESFSEQVRSNAVQMDIFKTAANVETIKLDEFSKKIQAHETKINSSKLESSLQNEKYRAELDQNIANLKIAEQELRLYETNLSKAIQISKAKATENELFLSKWAKEIAVSQSNQSTDLQKEIANHKGRIEILKTNIQYLLDDFNSQVKDADIRQAAADSGIRLYENLIAGAESSLNAIVTLTKQDET